MIYYHGTSALAADRIKKEGLIPRAMPGGDTWAKLSGDWLLDDIPDQSEPRIHSVYLTKRPVVAAWFANMAAQVNKSEPVVLTVDVPADLARDMVQDEEGSHADPDWSMRLEGSIPAEYIKRAKTVNKFNPNLGSEAGLKIAMEMLNEA